MSPPKFEIPANLSFPSPPVTQDHVVERALLTHQSAVGVLRRANSLDHGGSMREQDFEKLEHLGACSISDDQRSY